MYTIEKTKLIINEINQRRSEILEMQKMLMKVGLFFITAIGASAATLISAPYSNQIPSAIGASVASSTIASHSNQKPDNSTLLTNIELPLAIDIKVVDGIILALTQLEFFLAMIAVLIICVIAVDASYIRAQENKVNNLMGEYIIMWDSEISSRHLFHRYSPFWWTCLTLGGILYAFYLLLLRKVGSDWKGPQWVIAFFLVEAIVPIAILVFQWIMMERIVTHAKSKFYGPIP